MAKLWIISGITAQKGRNGTECLRVKAFAKLVALVGLSRYNSLRYNFAIKKSMGRYAKRTVRYSQRRIVQRLVGIAEW